MMYADKIDYRSEMLIENHFTNVIQKVTKRYLNIVM